MPKMSKKKIVGITGSMGSGKSMVSSLLAKHYPVLDVDRVNAKLLEKGNAGYRKLVRELKVPLDEEKEIDKKALAKIVFSNRQFRQSIEDILHPLILQEMESWVEEQNYDLVFVEMPLLFENELDTLFDEIWCVVCDEKVALERMEKKRHITREEAKARLACQYSPIIKMQQSDVVLYNNGTIEELENEVKLQLKRTTI